MNTSTPLLPPTPDPNDRKSPLTDPTAAQQATSEAKASTDAKAAEGKPHKLDLSLSQVLGGALAAMTAAALGSRLGVAGTITGAAVASIIAAIAGSLYTASLRHTREKVKTVWSGRIVTPGTDSSDAWSGSDAGATRVIPVSVDLVPDAPTWELPEAPLGSQRGRPSREIAWKAIIGGAVAAFAIAAVALTGFELVSGQAISGGKGTTIEQASKPQKPATAPSKKATPSKSATPSSSESATPSESSRATPEVVPSDAPTATESTAPTTQQGAPQPSDPPSDPTTSQTSSARSGATEAPTAGSSAGN